MLRTVLSVLAGYVALFLFVMVSFTILWTVLGQEGSFQSGTTEVTGSWLAFSIPLSFLAAVLGGMVAVWVAGSGGSDARARGRRAVAGLAGVVLVLGFVEAMSRTGQPQDNTPDAPPPAELTAFEAAGYADQPAWVAWLLPFLGSAGVVAGGAMALARRRASGEVSEPSAGDDPPEGPKS